MDIFVTPEWSKLTQLSVLHLSGPLGGYEAIGTFTVPDLKQLVLHFDRDYQCFHDPPLPDPLLPLFDTTALCSLTKLELSSGPDIEQVNGLPLGI